MPLYEYRCRSCERQFERLVRRASAEPAPLIACPDCQSGDVEQLVSLFAVDTPGTRHQHLQHGRQRGAKEREDRKRAEAEEVVRVHREHYE